LSFLTAQYGFACDNGTLYSLFLGSLIILIRSLVVNCEVVLSDSSIISANATAHTDLFWALKGGGNQFGGYVEHDKRLSLIVPGIATKYTMNTVPIGQVKSV
jgi:hypothetical protein